MSAHTGKKRKNSMKTAVVTDTASYLTPEQIKKYNIEREVIVEQYLNSSDLK